MAQLSYEAAQQMDRFPVADFAEVLGVDPALAGAVVGADVDSKRSTAGLGFEYGTNLQSVEASDSDMEVLDDRVDSELLLRQFLEEDEDNGGVDNEDLLANEEVNQRVDDLNAFLDSIQSDDRESDDPFSAAITRSVHAAVELKAKKQKKEQQNRHDDSSKVPDASDDEYNMDEKEDDSILKDMEAFLFDEEEVEEEDGMVFNYNDEEGGPEEVEDDSGEGLR